MCTPGRCPLFSMRGGSDNETCDGSDVVPAAEFNASVTDYLAGDIRADANGDGLLNEADLSAIVQRLVTPAE